MAKVTTAPAFTRPDTDDTIRSLSARIDEVARELHVQRTRQREIAELLDPLVRGHRNESLDVRAARRASLDRDEVDRRVLRLEDELDGLSRDIHERIERHVEQQLATFVQQDAADVRELDAALQRPVDIETRRRARAAAFEDATGRQVPDRGHWPELDATNADARVNVWREWVRMRGFAR